MTATEIDAGDDCPLTMPALIRRHSQCRAEDILLVTDETRLTWGEAESRSRLIAQGLLGAGVTKGSHVALLLPNGADFLLFTLAITRIGAVVLPLSTLSTADEIRGLLFRSDTSCLVAADEFRGRVFSEVLEKALPHTDFSRGEIHSREAPWLRKVWIAGEPPPNWHPDCGQSALEAMGQGVDEERLRAVEDRVSPADKLVIIHTSGSTSFPKGVIHTHGALIRHLDNINQIRDLKAGDAVFSVSPWFWVAGFGFALLGVLVAGATFVTSNARDAKSVLDLIEKERPDIATGFAPAVAWLAEDPDFRNRDFSWLRRGNLYPILAPDVRPADPALRHDIYGMTEVGGGLTMSGDESDLPERLRGSCGYFLPGFEAKIVDPQSGGECAKGDVGELWIRSPFMMDGYYGKPRSEVFEPDGWWRTSDAGLINEEGIFFLKGRLGNMIKTAGANVAPREVEAVMRELAGGRLCVVVGVPDDKRGQAVVGVIVAESGPGEVDPDQITRELTRKLSSYKVPRRIFVVAPDEIPTLSSGKLDLNKLTTMLEERWKAARA